MQPTTNFSDLSIFSVSICEYQNSKIQILKVQWLVQSHEAFWCQKPCQTSQIHLPQTGPWSLWVRSSAYKLFWWAFNSPTHPRITCFPFSSVAQAGFSASVLTVLMVPGLWEVQKESPLKSSPTMLKSPNNADFTRRGVNATVEDSKVSNLYSSFLLPGLLSKTRFRKCRWTWKEHRPSDLQLGEGYSCLLNTRGRGVSTVKIQLKWN